MYALNTFKVTGVVLAYQVLLLSNIYNKEIRHGSWFKYTETFISELLTYNGSLTPKMTATPGYNYLNTDCRNVGLLLKKLDICY